MLNPPSSLKARALRCLARRDYSRAGLQRKLASEANSEAELDALLDELQRLGFLADARYAQQRVVARAGRYGNERLQRELQQQGVSTEIIAEALSESGDEVLRCRQVWQKRFHAAPDSAESWAKQQRFLQYRGFSLATIRQVLRSLADEEVN